MAKIQHTPSEEVFLIIENEVLLPMRCMKPRSSTSGGGGG